jgi:uncharacterized ion transporter superfamily protein YfcC
MVLLFGVILLAALMSYLVPAGQFDRQVDEATGRTVVVAGTYHEVEQSPVNLFAAIVAIPRGLIAAADVIFLIFLIGGAFTVLDETGTLRRAVSSLVKHTGGSHMVIPIVSLFFAIGGVVENMQEEIIALVPVLLILTRRVGYRPAVAVSMSLGAAMVGSAFSPINPFQVQIAQKLAELPLGSGGIFRLVFLVLALALWIGLTMRYAERTRVAVQATEDAAGQSMSNGDGLNLGIVAATFAAVVWGMTSQDWGFNELSAAFLIMGMVIGIVGGLGISGTADAFVKGFRSMAYAAVLVGFARTVFVVLQDGQIVDTMINAMFSPLQELPLLVSAFGMMVAQTAIHVPVSSVSGQAVLTMPVLVPLSDLLGMSRQVTVLAYQYGAGLCDLITPTNGALMAILSIAGLTLADWLRFMLRMYLGLFAIGLLSIGVAIAIGL